MLFIVLVFLLFAGYPFFLLTIRVSIIEISLYRRGEGSSSSVILFIVILFSLSLPNKKERLDSSSLRDLTLFSRNGGGGDGEEKKEKEGMTIVVKIRTRRDDDVPRV